MTTLSKLTRAQIEALDRIGRRRKAGVKIGSRPGPGWLSPSMFRKLESLGLVMMQSESQKLVMLTYPGEKLFTELHPHSKYRVK